MSDLTEMLRDTTRRLFGDAWVKGQREFHPIIWSQVAEIGLPGLLVPEAAGGVGGQWRDALVVVEAMGEHAAALPLAETMLAGATVRPQTVALADNGDSRRIARQAWHRLAGEP